MQECFEVKNESSKRVNEKQIKKKKSQHLVYISWILETAKNVGLLAVKCMFTNETSQHPLELLSCLPFLAEVGVFLVSSETTFQSVI